PWLRKSIDANPNNPWADFYLSACLAHLGRLDEARAAIGTGLAFNPKFSIKRVRAFGESDNPVFLAQRERMIEARRMAGAPDGCPAKAIRSILADFRLMPRIPVPTVILRGNNPQDRMSALCQKQTFRLLLDIIVGGQGCSSSWSITRETSPSP